MKPTQLLLVTGTLSLFWCGAASAHDPVFSPGPHVLYKDGVEIHIGAHREKAGQERETELSLELTYGLTGDWAAGIELPYLKVADGADKTNGTGDARWFTKYRFWRKDTLGVQESAAVFLSVMQDNGDDKKTRHWAVARPIPCWGSPMVMKASHGIAGPASVIGAMAKMVPVCAGVTSGCSILRWVFD